MAKRGPKKTPIRAPLVRLKAVANIQDDSQDALLAELLAQAEVYILTYCNRTEMLESMRAGQVRLALLYFNRMGIEGESSHSEGGVSRSIDMLPADLREWLDAHRLLPGVARVRRASV